MNSKFFAAALIAATGFAAAPSFAGGNMTDEVGFVQPVPAVSSGYLTRAMVQHAYVQAQRNGTLLSTAEGAEVAATPALESDVTRAQVRAEARYAVKNGLTVGGEV